MSSSFGTSQLATDLGAAFQQATGQQDSYLLSQNPEPPSYDNNALFWWTRKGKSQLERPLIHHMDEAIFRDAERGLLASPDNDDDYDDLKKWLPVALRHPGQQLSLVMNAHSAVHANGLQNPVTDVIRVRYAHETKESRDVFEWAYEHYRQQLRGNCSMIYLSVGGRSSDPVDVQKRTKTNRIQTLYYAPRTSATNEMRNPNTGDNRYQLHRWLEMEFSSKAFANSDAKEKRAHMEQIMNAIVVPSLLNLMAMFLLAPTPGELTGTYATQKTLPRLRLRPQVSAFIMTRVAVQTTDPVVVALPGSDEVAVRLPYIRAKHDDAFYLCQLIFAPALSPPSSSNGDVNSPLKDTYYDLMEGLDTLCNTLYYVLMLENKWELQLFPERKAGRVRKKLEVAWKAKWGQYIANGFLAPLLRTRAYSQKGNIETNAPYTLPEELRNPFRGVDDDDADSVYDDDNYTPDDDFFEDADGELLQWVKEKLILPLHSNYSVNTHVLPRRRDMADFLWNSRYAQRTPDLTLPFAMLMFNNPFIIGPHLRWLQSMHTMHERLLWLKSNQYTGRDYAVVPLFDPQQITSKILYHETYLPTHPILVVCSVRDVNRYDAEGRRVPTMSINGIKGHNHVQRYYTADLFGLNEDIKKMNDDGISPKADIRTVRSRTTDTTPGTILDRPSNFPRISLASDTPTIMYTLPDPRRWEAEIDPDADPVVSRGLELVAQPIMPMRADSHAWWFNPLKDPKRKEIINYPRVFQTIKQLRLLFGWKSELRLATPFIDAQVPTSFYSAKTAKTDPERQIPLTEDDINGVYSINTNAFAAWSSMGVLNEYNGFHRCDLIRFTVPRYPLDREDYSSVPISITQLSSVYKFITEGRNQPQEALQFKQRTRFFNRRVFQMEHIDWQKKSVNEKTGLIGPRKNRASQAVYFEVRRAIDEWNMPAVAEPTSNVAKQLKQLKKRQNNRQRIDALGKVDAMEVVMPEKDEEIPVRINAEKRVRTADSFDAQIEQFLEATAPTTSPDVLNELMNMNFDHLANVMATPPASPATQQSNRVLEALQQQVHTSVVGFFNKDGTSNVKSPARGGLFSFANEGVQPMNVDREEEEKEQPVFFSPQWNLEVSDDNQELMDMFGLRIAEERLAAIDAQK